MFNTESRSKPAPLHLLNARQPPRSLLWLWIAVLCLPLLASCAATSQNMPLDAPAAFANGQSQPNDAGGYDIDLNLVYWKSAAPLFAFGFTRTEVSNTKASADDFRNMWDRKWTRLESYDGGRPRATLKPHGSRAGTHVNIYMVVWESTTSNDLAEYRFFGSRPAGAEIEKFKLKRAN